MRTCSANQGAKVRTFFESCKYLLLFLEKTGCNPSMGAAQIFVWGNVYLIETDSISQVAAVEVVLV